MSEDDQYKIAKLTETHRTMRYGIVAGVVVAGFILIGFAVYMVVQPAWLTLCLALFGPSGMIYLLIQAGLKYVKKTHRRTVVLEKILDPGRSSSLQEPVKQPKEEKEGVE